MNNRMLRCAAEVAPRRTDRTPASHFYTVASITIISQLISLVLLLFCTSAHANFSYFFGSGTAHVSKAGTLHHAQNEFQGYLNPGFGSMAMPSHSVAVVMNQLNVSPLKDILLQHPNFPHSEDLPERGNLAFPEPILFGAQMSLTLPVLTQFDNRKFRFHFTGFVPFTETLFLGTKSTFIPSYVFYEGRNRHLDGHLSASGVIIPGVLGVGSGMSISLSAASRMSLIMNASTNQVTSDSRTQVVPNFSYFAGVYVHPLSWVHVSMKGHTQESWGFKVTAESNAVVWESTNVGIDMTGESKYNFLPPRAILAVTTEITDSISLTPQIEYHAWSLYVSHRIKVELPGTGLDPAYPDVDTKDIWIPRIGMAWKTLSWASLYSGVAYMPTPIEDISGIHNDVDTDRIILGFGIEFTGKNFLMAETDNSHFRFGIFGQFHYLIPRTITKSGESIGAPGYELRGNATVIGTQFSFDV
jgi:hypothetical protein